MWIVILWKLFLINFLYENIQGGMRSQGQSRPQSPGGGGEVAGLQYYGANGGNFQNNGYLFICVYICVYMCIYGYKYVKHISDYKCIFIYLYK
jgi:hypothetical protein